MEFAEVVRRRRMIRSFDTDREVAPELLEMLLKQAIRAPSAGHTQGWRFFVLTDITTAAFWSITATGTADAWLRGMRTAPVLVLCYSDQQAYLERYAEPDKGWSDRDPDRWPMPYWHIDVGMAAMTLLLGATDAGLGACFFGLPRRHWPAVAARFEVPAGLEPVGVVALGYPAVGDASRPRRRTGRKPFDEVVTFARADPAQP